MDIVKNKDCYIKIKAFMSPDEQKIQIGNHIWFVARLIVLARDLPVMDIPVKHLNISQVYTDVPLRGMVMHFRAVDNADLSYPIILDEDGELMDGRHRIIKTLLQGKETIKAVRFDSNPAPCRVEEG